MYDKKIEKDIEKPVLLSPYKVFWEWIFDGNLKSSLPSGPNIPDLLNYKSPISELFLLRSFMKCGKFNAYLNSYLNNFGIRNVDKLEIFMFIKEGVRDFKISRNDIFFCNQYKSCTKLFLKLRNRYKDLKNEEISMLCDIVDESENKASYYTSLGLDVVKKETLKVKKKSDKKSSKIKKISLDDFMKNFKIMPVDE
jgi:hypothetical protein